VGFSISSISTSSAEITPFVINGAVVNQSDYESYFKYQIGIFDNSNNLRCGGVLIDAEWVLSAADYFATVSSVAGRKVFTYQKRSSTTQNSLYCRSNQSS